MKLPNNIIFELLALLMTTGVTFIDAECLFCINATIVDPTLEVAGGETCASLSEAAASLEADEFLCADVALAAQVDCCPSFFNVTTVDLGSVINPTFNETTTTISCSICANGLTVSDNTVIPFAEANGSTCAETLALALNILDSSTMCTAMKDAESICCPESSLNPCQVCVESGGITVDGATPIFDGAMKTCADVVVDALTVEEGSDVCTQMKVSEVTCCSESILNTTTTTTGNGTESSSSVAPTISPSLNGTMVSTTATDNNNETTTTNITTCQVCIDGITAGTKNIVIGNGKTCGDLISDAAITDASDVGCSMMQDAQLTCCPTPAQVPCDVCPNGGITVMEDTAITVAKTCGDLMVDALNTEEESDICSGMKAVAEPICCPANTTAPTTAPEMNSTTVVPSSATTLAPSSTADVTESLAPSTTATSSSTESSASSSTTTSPTVLSVTTPSPSLMATSTTDALPTSLAPTAAGLEPTDKEPLAFETQGSGGEAPPSSSSSGFSYSSSPQRVGFFTTIGCAMVAVSFVALV